MGGDENQGVGRRIATAAGWMVLIRLGFRLLGLLSTAILARLLIPADFGLVALAAMIVVFLEVISEFSFDVVLIRDQDADRRKYDTVWTLTVLRSTGIAIALVASAHILALFFKEPRLQAVIYWIAFGNLVVGFRNVGVVDFVKELQFHKEFIFTLSAKLVSMVVTLGLAVVWRDYRALVAGLVAWNLARVSLSYLMHPFRPRLGLSSAGEIFHFSKWLLINSISDYVYQRSGMLIIGKLGGAGPMGLFSVAYEIASLPTTELIAPIRRALLPGYSKLAGDRGKLIKGLLDTLALMLLLGLPVGVGMAVVSGPLVQVFLGPKWLEAIPLVQMLALYGVVEVGTGNLGPALIAIGKPRILTMVRLATLVAFIPTLVWATLAYGALGVAIAMLAAAIVRLVTLWSISLGVLGMRVRLVWVHTWRSLLSAGVMGLAVAGVQRFARYSPQGPEALVVLLALVGFGAVVYIGLHLALWWITGRPTGPESQIIETVRTFVVGRLRRSVTDV